MRDLKGRIERLREAHFKLNHTRFRTTKDLSLWDHANYESEPIVIRKARSLALLLNETPPIIMEDELPIDVWGFSAYFVTLTKEYQEEIIARTIHV